MSFSTARISELGVGTISRGQKRRNPFSNSNPSSQSSPKIQGLPTNNSRTPMSNNRMVNAANGGKLLLISDLEGCAEKSSTSVEQSRIMCSPDFFDSLKTFLSENPMNKVAFLGDYFDQGDMVLDSINGIMGLYNAYPDRVIIIVGNRDVNKLRFAYEMGLTLEESKSDLKWPVWNPGFYDPISTTATDLHERIKTIVSKSMGAKYPVHIAKGLGEADANYLLLSCISDSIAEKYRVQKSDAITINITDKYKTFVDNIRQLFSVAKIVHYDKDFMTLMSHAGGMDTYFFHDKSYYQNIIEGISTIPQYYSKIEKARQMLMVEPTSKIELTSANIADTLKIYNGLFTEVVSGVINKKQNNNSMNNASKNNLLAKHCLLQALGLKPDAEKHFVSFIQSCDNTGCKGPAAGDSGALYDANYTTFQSMLVAAGVKVLASGHVPHCAPVPLVYKRSDGNGLLFVLNDTSNGYRPSSRITGLNKYPLAYVEAGGVGAGVGMLPTLGSDGMNTDEFGPMFGKWTYETAPTFSTESKQVEYGASGALTFPARTGGPYTPAAFVKPTQGGRRTRTRKNKKVAARKHKKTRKAVRKHKTRKSAAARKHKHKKTRKH